MLGANEHVDVIGGADHEPFQQLKQRECRFPHDHRPDGLRNRGLHRATRGPQIVFKEAEIALIYPINLRRGLQTVKEPQRLRIGLARRTLPAPIGVADVAMGHAFCQLHELVFHFALDPPTAIGAEHKEIRRVEDADGLAFRARVHEFDGARLIIELEDRGVMLKLIDGRQFAPMTLKLNGAAHFLTGITPCHIPRGPAHQTRWWRRTNLTHDSLCLVRERVLEAPRGKLVLTQHRSVFPFKAIRLGSGCQVVATLPASLREDLSAIFAFLITFSQIMRYDHQAAGAAERWNGPNYASRG